MSVLYNLTKSEEFEGVTLIFPLTGETMPVSKDHKNYDQIKALILADDLDAEKLFGLAAPFEAIFKNLTKLSDRVSRKGVNLFFDGDRLDSTIAKKIIETLDEEGFETGKTWQSYVNFLERLMQNPSQESREHFYAFVESNGLAITPEGYVVFYKGVNPSQAENQGGARYVSSHAGYGIVTSADGQVVEYDHANLPNDVGFVVEIPRSKVDTNRDAACSVGLHVGAYSYASTFARVLLDVLVDPRDVVSVPSDHYDQKVRVTRYKIVGVNESRTNYGEGVIDVPEQEPVLPEAEGIDRQKVEEFKAMIPNILNSGWDKKLVTYANKRVTSAQRTNFKKAIEELGLE